MNRSTFHTRLARATVAVVLAVSAIGCATAPESTPTSQTPPAELASEPHEQRTTELPDVSLQSPVANPPEADSPSLEEPSSVWIDDTLARQTPLQQTELAVQPPPPEIDARSAVAWSSAPATAPESLAPTQAVAPTTVAPVAADPAADRSLALIEPRVPAGERPASAETVSPTTPSGATPSGATPSRPATTNPVRAVPSASSPDPVTSAAAPLAQGAQSAAQGAQSAAQGAQSAGSTTSAATPGDAAATDSLSSDATTSRPVTASPTTSGPTTTDRPASDEGVSGATISGTVAPSTARPAPLWNERAASIASGSEFSVVLPGSGWLYVGKEYGDGEIRLLGKSRSDGDEVFRFRIGEPGDYGLWFQQQDSLTGSLLNERLSVRAGADEEATTIALANLPEGSSLSPGFPGSNSAAASDDRPATSRGAAASVPGASVSRTGAMDAEGRVSSVTSSVDGRRGDGGGDDGGEALAGEPSFEDALGRALRLLDGGERVDALAAFADGAGRGLIDIAAVDNNLVDRFVAAARNAAGEEMPSAVIRSFWRAIASSGSAAAPEARRALLEIAARAGDAGEIAAAVSALEAAGEASADDMTRAADALFGADREAEALPLLARAVTRDEAAFEGAGRLDDDRIFALARLLEQPGPDRDLRRAASLYRLILEDRPLSGHWDESRSRLEYLRRHYFEVR